MRPSQRSSAVDDTATRALLPGCQVVCDGLYIHLAGVAVDVRTARDKEGPCFGQRFVNRHMLSTTAPVPWLRQVIDRSLPPDANDDEVVTVDVPVNTSPISVSPDVIADWVVDRTRAFGLASVERHPDALIEGLICWRTPDGPARSSVPRRHVHYAATGFDWGFGGSGAADLALNVLAVFLPLAPEGTGVALRDGSSVSEAAWALHQAFKYDLIATLPRAGGHITAKMIWAWITAHPVVGADPLYSPLEHVDGGQHVALGQ